MIADLNTNYL